MIAQTVGDVMTTTVRTIPPEMTASEIAKLFAEYGIGSAAVTDRQTGELVGIVTESDIMAQIASGADITTREASEFMAAPVVTVTSTACIHDAAQRMKANSVCRLPVVDEALVGILTTSDLANYVPTLRNAIVRQRKIEP